MSGRGGGGGSEKGFNATGEGGVVWLISGKDSGFSRPLRTLQTLAVVHAKFCTCKISSFSQGAKPPHKPLNPTDPTLGVPRPKP